MTRRSIWITILCVVASLAVFVGGGRLVGRDFVNLQNRQHLGELNQLVLRRAERQIDTAFIALSALMEAGATNCETRHVVLMRQQVYSAATVKDIRVVNEHGRVQCSAFPDTLAFDISVGSASSAFDARYGHIKLVRLEQQSGVALGVLWPTVPGSALLSVLNIDLLLVDVLPTDLQGRSQLRLSLPGGGVLSQLDHGRLVDDATTEFTSFEAQSSRFPISVFMRVETAALANWHNSPLTYFQLFGAILGLAFGALLSWAVARPASLLAEMDEALAGGRFVPYAQPVFSLDDDAITGCEILMRWLRADGSVVAPDRFIWLAEESGRIVPMTRQLMRDALCRLRPLMKRDRSFQVGFNISPRHLLAPGFVDEAATIARQADVPMDQIVFEVTERQELGDMAVAAEVVADLNRRGIKVAIDDVGTGHSGLSYLHKLGAQIIKIDKFFIDAVETDYSARVVVELLVRAARQLNMRTVAEGIERNIQLSWLKEVGIDEGQGIVLSGALPLNDFCALAGERVPARQVTALPA